MLSLGEGGGKGGEIRKPRENLAYLFSSPHSCFVLFCLIVFGLTTAYSEAVWSLGRCCYEGNLSGHPVRKSKVDCSLRFTGRRERHLKTTKGVPWPNT